MLPHYTPICGSGKIANRKVRDMHRHHKNPAELRELVRKFIGGQFVLKKGRGSETEELCGKIVRIDGPDDSIQKMIIHYEELHRLRIGCDADFVPEEQWDKRSSSTGKLPFEYSWFYPQQKHERLKLQSVPRGERCWLCSSSDPMYLDLFRTMLRAMFLKESLRKTSVLQAWFRKLRDRIVLFI
jgi:hypothetical protein